MARTLKVAAAQMGAVHLVDERAHTLKRMIVLLEQAKEKGADLVLFPEIAFTTFFPRHLLSEDEVEKFFEQGDDVTQSLNTKPFFDKAKELDIDVSVGFGEKTSSGQHFNTTVYVSKGKIKSKYRKVHLPGTSEPFSNPEATNQLEKRYFLPGDLGFKAFRAHDAIMGMMICNDRRWPEAWRVLGLQGAELVLCGFNTAAFAPDLWGTSVIQTPEEAEVGVMFHHKLVMQANSYMNATWSVCAARCGADDDKYKLIAGSTIVNPEGYIVAESKTNGDEIIFAEIDLDECSQGKKKTFNFELHRRTEAYSLITKQTGVITPPVQNGL